MNTAASPVQDLIDQLSVTRPEVVITLSREVDYARPPLKGYSPCYITVKATTIRNGRFHEASDQLNGSFYKGEESLDEVQALVKRVLVNLDRVVRHL